MHIQSQFRLSCELVYKGYAFTTLVTGDTCAKPYGMRTHMEVYMLETDKILYLPNGFVFIVDHSHITSSLAQNFNAYFSLFIVLTS